MARVLPDPVEEVIRQVPDGQPIVLINLLRFHHQVTVQGEVLTGRQLYQRYVTALTPVLMAAGGRPIWTGQGRLTLAGPPGEHWDEIILVAYPSRKAFERLLSAPAYQACTGLRAAALEDSRLIVATSPRRNSRAAWSMYKLAAGVRRRGSELVARLSRGRAAAGKRALRPAANPPSGSRVGAS